MTSEIRTNSLKSRAGLSTVTLTDSGPMFSGITTFVDNSGFNLGTGSSIFSPATNTLTFGTNSNERLRIDSSGRMGLGTNNPEEILHVKAASETVNSRDGVIFQSSSSLAADTGLPLVFSSHIGNDPNYSVASIAGRKENASSGDGAGYLQFATGSSAGAITEKARIDSSGRLLLNTETTYVSNQMMIVKGASPSAGGNRPYDGQLAIEGSEENGAINTGGVLAFIGHSGAGSRGFGSIRCLKEDGTSGNYGSYMSFETRANGSAPAEKFRITSDGKVGIGEDSPDQMLHIKAANPFLELEGTAGTTGDTGIFLNANGNHWLLRADNYGSQNLFTIKSGDTSSSTHRFTINASGKVGINKIPDTSGGLVQLMYNEVFTSGTTNLLTSSSKAVLRLQTSNNSSKSLFFGGIDESATPYLQVGNMSTASGGATATYPLVFQPYGGNVGVNTTSPASALEVRGDISVISSLAKIGMTDADGGDAFQIRNDAGTFKIRNSTDGRDDISITNNALTFGGVAKITDNNSIFFGNDNDIEMRHNATSSQNQIIGINHDFLLQSHGTIYMQCFQSGNSTNGNVLTANYNAGTALYYQNGERLVTTNAGCKVSNGLSFNNWLNISKNGTYAPASVGHGSDSHEGIFWHSGSQYSIFRSSGSWGGPNYQQLNLNWPTGIRIDGGYEYGLSGARFNCHALPTNNNNFDLGTSALRWRDVYCNQGAFNNSDIELKQDIASLSAAEMKAAKRLSALFKTYRWKDAVEEKGTDKARTHTGMIAQQIQAAMSAEGLDATKYGLFGIDEWYENDKKEIITLDQLKDDIPDPLDSSKTVTPPSIEGHTKVTRYSVRYTELLSFIAAYNDQRFADLESRVAHLQESITKIETLEQDNIALRTRVTNLEGD